MDNGTTAGMVDIVDLALFRELRTGRVQMSFCRLTMACEHLGCDSDCGNSILGFAINS